MYGAPALEDLREIKDVWRGEVGRAFRSSRVVVLLTLFLLFTALALTVTGFFNHKMNQQIAERMQGSEIDAEAMVKQTLAAKKQMLSTFFDVDESLVEVLAELPLVLLIVFKLALRFVPIFIALMGFDQLSGEIGPKSIRYLIVRVKRSSIILGKFLAQGTVLATLLFVSTLVMVLVAKILNSDFGLGLAAISFLKLYGSALILSLAYLGLTTLCSAVTRQSGITLVLNVMGLFVIWFVAFIGETLRFPGEAAGKGLLAQLTQESYGAYARYASVWHYGGDLLHPRAGVFLSAALAHVGFALVFLGIAQFALRKQDL